MAKEINILSSSGDLDKEQIYFMTKAPNIMKMSDVKEQTLDIDCWVIYEDTNSEGETQQLFSLLTPEGEAYATNSATFLDSFQDIIGIFEHVDRIKVGSGVSKNNRTYLTAIYAK